MRSPGYGDSYTQPDCTGANLPTALGNALDWLLLHDGMLHSHFAIRSSHCALTSIEHRRNWYAKCESPEAFSTTGSIAPKSIHSLNGFLVPEVRSVVNRISKYF